MKTLIDFIVGTALALDIVSQILMTLACVLILYCLIRLSYKKRREVKKDAG